MLVSNLRHPEKGMDLLATLPVEPHVAPCGSQGVPSRESLAKSRGGSQ